ncbi:hypothetical protein SELMODRAFT_443863 [Selaginella moellendorffii]|uniref:Uncharacterized protein n=1 Tax=Selaginella moellendorffii TaxID=88036 RepID=D8S4Z5_SELML|nr:hypothetical protein SELMODRAFT_443863 [Selaginella moellendorffii]
MQGAQFSSISKSFPEITLEMTACGFDGENHQRSPFVALRGSSLLQNTSRSRRPSLKSTPSDSNSSVLISDILWEVLGSSNREVRVCVNPWRRFIHKNREKA